ncbi:hypothetical protein CRG98_016785 [Punica granatum]|uniref:Uncharacterized protein n=1 Tax=Punica granatum TaxID=22663 RepID=A0A2I0K2R1_PUNGR|nr:hypothetical protein CRG98_016785 [Punica granatum]
MVCTIIVRTRISSRRARMREPKCNAAWECPPSRGRATNTREKESPLPVYDPKVEGRCIWPNSWPSLEYVLLNNECVMNEGERQGGKKGLKEASSDTAVCTVGIKPAGLRLTPSSIHNPRNLLWCSPVREYDAESKSADRILLIVRFSLGSKASRYHHAFVLDASHCEPISEHQGLVGELRHRHVVWNHHPVCSLIEHRVLTRLPTQERRD